MNGKLISKWLPFLVFFTCVAGLDAQPPSPGFNTQTFTTHDGLPHSYVLSLRQDSLGYLWVGTIYGVCRFDGNQFENINFQDQVPNISINGIIETRNNRLIMKARKGNLILSGNKITVLDDSSYVHEYPILKNEGEYFAYTHPTPEGTFLNLRDEIIFTDLAGKKTYISPLLPPFYFVYIMGYREGQLYFFTNNGIYIYQQGRVRSLFEEELAGKRIYSCYLDTQGRIWICTHQDGVSVADPGEEKNLRHRISLTSNLIAGFYEDREGNIWIAGYEGLVRVSNASYTFSSTKVYPFFSSLFSMTKDRRGNILFFSEPHGLTMWHKQNFSHSDSNPFKGLVVDVACTDDLNQVWCMTRSNHVMMYDGTKLRDYTLPAHNLAGDRETDIVYEPQRKRIWVAGGHLSYGNTDIFKTFRGADQKKIFLPRLLLPLPEGRLLVCTRGNQILLIDKNDHVTDVNPSGRFISDRIHRVYTDTSGNIWISYLGTGLVQCQLTDSGLIVRKSYTTESGLKNNMIQSIAIDGQNRIWLATMAGLTIIDPTIADPDSNVYIRHLGPEDGLPASGLNSSCLMLDDEGFMWYSTNHSVMRFRTQDVKTADSPPMTNIESIRLNQQEVDWTKYTDSLMGAFQLPLHPVFNHFENTISISSNAVSMINSRNFQYSYMLTGLEKGWSKSSAENSITFSELNPGTYTFRVRARKSNSAWSAPASFTFTIRPALWQTWWFNPFLLCLAGGVMYGLFRIRLRQIRKEERLRRRLASDLHDDIGSSLSSISFYSEAIKQQVKESTPKVIPLLDKMESASENTVNAMSDIVWAINPEQDKGANLINRMRAYASELCGMKGVRLEFEDDRSLEKVKLAMPIRKNLYLIFKEAVTNTLKYSKCTILRVRIAHVQDHIWMEIEDNGIGFDGEHEFSGNGLKNMRHRAEEIGAAFTLTASPGKGCKVQVEV